MQDGMASAGAPLGVTTVIMGGYTADMEGNAVGITTSQVSSADQNEIQLTQAAPFELDSPSYLIKHPNRPWLFAVSETEPGRLSSLSMADDGGLTALGSVETGGDGSCHLALDSSGNFLVVANYGSGSISSFAIQPDGSVSERLDLLQFTGSGPDPERQAGPHAHQTVLDGTELLVCDLGTDLIHRIRLGRDGLFSTVADPIRLPPGSGPRHLVRLGDYLVVACELGAAVWLGRRTAAGWEAIQTLPSSTASVAGRTYPSAIVADGDRVFLANRGAGTIAIFDLDRHANTLVRVTEFPGGGEWPRDLALNPGHLWVANQTNDVVSVFSTSQLPPVRVAFELPSPSPACIVLLTEPSTTIT